VWFVMCGSSCVGRQLSTGHPDAPGGPSSVIGEMHGEMTGASTDTHIKR
jgi:hypothetical protein